MQAIHPIDTTSPCLETDSLREAAYLIYTGFDISLQHDPERPGMVICQARPLQAAQKAIVEFHGGVLVDADRILSANNIIHERMKNFRNERVTR